MTTAAAWGGSHAAELLTAILAVHPRGRRLQRRIGNYLDHTFCGFAELEHLVDEGIFREMVVLWRNDRTSKVSFDPKCDSLVRSIITGKARALLRAVST